MPKDGVEEIARTIFGQEVSRYEDFEGTYFDGNGYFIDFSVLSDKTGNVCNLSSDDLLPGYANVEMIEPIGENHWECLAVFSVSERLTARKSYGKRPDSTS